MMHAPIGAMTQATDMQKNNTPIVRSTENMEIVPPRRPQIGRSLAWHLLSDTATHRFHTGSSNIRWSQYSHVDFMPVQHPAMWNKACRTAFTKNNASKSIFFQTRPARARVDTLVPSLAGVLKHAATQGGPLSGREFAPENSRKAKWPVVLAKTVSPIFWREIRAGKNGPYNIAQILGDTVKTKLRYDIHAPTNRMCRKYSS